MPFVLVLFEWWHNSIIVTSDRLWLYFIVGMAYMSMLVFLAIFVYPDSTIYHSMDFVDKPAFATLIGVIIMSIWIVASFIWPIVTKKRLAQL